MKKKVNAQNTHYTPDYIEIPVPKEIQIPLVEKEEIPQTQVVGELQEEFEEESEEEIEEDKIKYRTSGEFTDVRDIILWGERQLKYVESDSVAVGIHTKYLNMLQSVKEYKDENMRKGMFDMPDKLEQTSQGVKPSQVMEGQKPLPFELFEQGKQFQQRPNLEVSMLEKIFKFEGNTWLRIASGVVLCIILYKLFL